MFAFRLFSFLDAKVNFVFGKSKHFAKFFTEKFAFMSLSPSERARIVVRYLAKKSGITQAQVGQKIGYTNKSAFSAVLGGSKALPLKFGERLAALDPEINPDFLTGASDDMLRPGYEQPAVPEFLAGPAERPAPSGVFLPLELVQMFTDLSATIRSQQETIRLLVGEKDAAAAI